MSPSLFRMMHLPLHVTVKKKKTAAKTNMLNLAINVKIV